MRHTTILILSAVTLLLAGGVMALALINPLILIGLAPVLLAVAAIIRAIAGSTTDRANNDELTNTTGEGAIEESNEPRP